MSPRKELGIRSKLEFQHVHSNDCVRLIGKQTDFICGKTSFGSSINLLPKTHKLVILSDEHGNKRTFCVTKAIFKTLKKNGVI